MSRTAATTPTASTTAGTGASGIADAIGAFNVSGNVSGASADPASPVAANPGGTARKPRRGITITSHILAALSGLFIFYVGITFLLTPHETFMGFGLPEAQWPVGEMTALLNIKGGRDIGLGLITFILLATRQTRALGWTLIAMSVMPFIDMTIVLSYEGSTATALAVHGATALYVLLVGVFIAWNERIRKTN